MGMSVTSGAITIAPFITQFDLEGGLETSTVRFTIKSNKDWKLATEIGTITSNPHVRRGRTGVNYFTIDL